MNIKEIATMTNGWESFLKRYHQEKKISFFMEQGEGQIGAHDYLPQRRFSRA